MPEYAFVALEEGAGEDIFYDYRINQKDVQIATSIFAESDVQDALHYGPPYGKSWLENEASDYLVLKAEPTINRRQWSF